MPKTSHLTALSTALILAAGCSNTQVTAFTDQARQLGRDYGTPLLCGAGMVAGGALGYAMNGKDGILVGAGVGTVLGCIAGSIWQERMQELDRVAKEEGLNISVQQIETVAVNGLPQETGLVAQVDDMGMFPTGSAELTPSGLVSVRKLAAVFAKEMVSQSNQSQQRFLLVVGHTDATGSAELNQRLSQQRAKAVGDILNKAGIPAEAIYFQGAGASRPIADNTDPILRAKNRRVEIVEVTSKEMLARRINAEQSNSKYLVYGTSTKKPIVQTRSASIAVAPSELPAAESKTRSSTLKSAKPAKVLIASESKALVDFAGVPSNTKAWTLGHAMTPKAGGFSLIAKAYANDIPMSSCVADMPRTSGDALNLATAKPLGKHETRDYWAGYNNRVWANTVNGHLVTISPVSILRDNAKVAQQPFVQIVENYKQSNSKTHGKLQAIANTYEGDSEVLYRVFVKGADTAVSCMDVVFSKQEPKTLEGALFYDHNDESYTATFTPIRT
ncbi:OmpA family protein [Halopseudomonas pelagia]|uniref:OmpA family protein n=1 Tax=Halopseudomonas pelagia TaxID=553151 RepID=UPI0003A6E57C|nr:OmpA family protein [Halopseudomonas pelagia]